MSYQTDRRSRTRAITVYVALLFIGAALGFLVRFGVITDRTSGNSLGRPLESLHSSPKRAVRFWAIVLKKSASAPAGTGLKSRQAYLPFQAGAICAGIGTSLAILRRFWAVAASRNSSLAPFGPRRRKRSSFRMRLRCANSISTFLRCRRDVT